MQSNRKIYKKTVKTGKKLRKMQKSNKVENRIENPFEMEHSVKEKNGNLLASKNGKCKKISLQFTPTIFLHCALLASDFPQWIAKCNEKNTTFSKNMSHYSSGHMTFVRAYSCLIIIDKNDSNRYISILHISIASY